MIKNISYSYIITTIIAFIISFCFSYLIGTVFFVIATLVSKRVTTIGYLYVIFIMSLISFTNYCDWNDGDYDILRYYKTWESLSNTENLEQALVVISLLRTDYFFYFITYLFTLVFPSDPRWFGFVFTFITAFLIYCSLYNFSKKEQCLYIVNNSWCLVLFSIGFIFVIRFFDFTNGYRQHFAFALYMFIYSLSISNKKKYILLIISILLHWSMSLLYFLSLFFIIMKGNPVNRWKLILISILVGTMGFGIIIKLLSSYSYILDYLLQEELGIDKKIMVIMFLSTLTMYYISNKLNFSKETMVLLLSFALIDCIFLLRSTVTLRMSFNYTDFLVAFSPIVFHNSKVSNNRDVFYLMMTIWIFFAIYNVLNWNNGSFRYLIFSDYNMWMSMNDIICSPLIF